jgi:hypothetical protein
MSSVTRFYQSGEFHKVEQILIDAGLNENQIRMSFELKLQLTGTTKKRCFYGCNFRKKSGRICRIILFRLLSAIGCQADYDDT